jgi:hypothetical protein
MISVFSRSSFSMGLIGTVPLAWYLMGLSSSLEYPSFLDYVFIIFPILAIIFGVYVYYKDYSTLDKIFAGLGFIFGLASIIFRIITFF